MEWWGWVIVSFWSLWAMVLLNKIALALERAADQSTHIALELTQMAEAWEKEIHDRP